MSYNYEFVRVWTVPRESMTYFATFGGVMMLGTFAGGFIAGSLTVKLGWESYFYLCGGNFVVMLALYYFFIAVNPEECNFMSKEEKMLYPNKDSEKESEAKKASYFQLFRRSYLLAFCIFIFCTNMIFCTLMANMPFYLREVVKMRTEDISVILLVSGEVIK